MDSDLATDKIFEQLRKDLNDKGQSVRDIIVATGLDMELVIDIVENDPDIVWVCGKGGIDLYISGLHLDREGTY